uniref:Olfactory receptor 9G1-like n=1 Tax=Castor canadensis TaxID=51338 RepID=A0A8B7U0T1_CASCN
MLVEGGGNLKRRDSWEIFGSVGCDLEEDCGPQSGGSRSLSHETGNHTVTEFILLGFTTDPEMQLVLFVMFFGVYSVTLLGNTTFIVLICKDSQFQTPMYFFIGKLSFLDLWHSSVYTPKILMTCISDDKSILFVDCIVQFFSAVLGYTEYFLLAAMAYYHYVAISKLLFYSQAMSGRLCFCLAIYFYTGGFINKTVFFFFLSQ